MFAIEDALDVPVRFVGVGEQVGDLLPVRSRRVRRRSLRLAERLRADGSIALHVDHATSAGERPSMTGEVEQAADRRRDEDDGGHERPPSGARNARRPQADDLGQQAGAERRRELGPDRTDVERRRDAPERRSWTSDWRTDVSVMS